MSFNNLSNYTGMAGGGGLELSSQIAGLGSETGQVADGDTLLEALAKINDRLPLSGGLMSGDITYANSAAYNQPQIHVNGYETGVSMDANTRVILVSSGLGMLGVKFGQGVITRSTEFFGISTAEVNGAADVKLYRDGSGVWASRNSANAQEFRVYSTYTDASNYERLALRTAAGDYTIAAEAAGTGTQRNLVLSGANRAAHIADVSSGTDAAYETAINAIIAALESHGIAATS